MGSYRIQLSQDFAGGVGAPSLKAHINSCYLAKMHEIERMCTPGEVGVSLDMAMKKNVIQL